MAIRKFLLITSLCFFVAGPAVSQTKNYLRGFEQAALLVESWDTIGNIYTLGTGFFYLDTATSKFFIVTNRHVFLSHDSLQIRYNDYQDYPVLKILHLVDSVGLPIWKSHLDTTVDLALYDMKGPWNVKILDSPRLKAVSEIDLGDGVYFFGFPLTERTSDNKIYPMMRHGAVSYIVKQKIAFGIQQKVYPAGTILIDATVLNGNSGGAVISVPKEGTSKISFIGVIQGNIIFSKTGENLDLGIVVPAEYIPAVVAQFK